MPDTTTSFEIGELFEKLKREWKSKTRYMSNSAQMATVWPYQQTDDVAGGLYGEVVEFMKRPTS
jgi:hypothetical protein